MPAFRLHSFRRCAGFSPVRGMFPLPVLVLALATSVPAGVRSKPLWNTNLQTAIGLVDTESSIVRGDGALLEPDGDIGFWLVRDGTTRLRPNVLRQYLVQGRFPVVITEFENAGVHWSSTIFTAPTAAGPCDIAVLRIANVPPRLHVRIAAGFFGDRTRLQNDRSILVGTRAVRWDAAGHAEARPRKWGYDPDSETQVFTSWARPQEPADPAFRNIRAGMNGHAVVYRFHVEPGAACPVALGLCEGYWRTPGKRIEVLQVEGAPAGKVDTIRDIGPEKPRVFLFRGKDENGDGLLTVTCRAAPQAEDQNCILNAVWILRRPFRQGDADRLRRHAGDLPLLYGVDCGGPGDHSARPEPRIVWPLESGGSRTCWMAVAHSPGKSPPAFDAAGLKAAESAAIAYWRDLYARGVHLHIADKEVEDLWDMSLANVFMLRDRMHGFAVVKPGETMYDSFWYRDGAYLVLAQDMAGYPRQARESLELFWRSDLPVPLKRWGQQPDGCWAVPPNEWDGQGQAMWALWRHYQLTGDKAWLARVYSALRRGMQWIRNARAKTKQAAAAKRERPAFYGLFPKGFGERIDHPLGYILYHDFWGVLGARCGWQAAQALNTPDRQWMQHEYEDFRQCVARACLLALNTRKDHVIPGAPGRPSALIWGGIAAVYPCEALPIHSGMVNATFRRMEARAAEGLYRFVSEEKIWPYYSTDWAQAYLFRGEYEKALRIFHAYCAHASPTRGWIEEIFLESRYGTGDMPHGWAAADYIMLLRDMLVLERDDTLHLMPCVDVAWLPPGEFVKIAGCPTNFGSVSCTLERPEARRLVYTLAARWRHPPRRLILHLPVGLPASRIEVETRNAVAGNRAITAAPPLGRDAELRIAVRPLE